MWQRTFLKVYEMFNFTIEGRHSRVQDLRSEKSSKLGACSLEKNLSQKLCWQENMLHTSWKNMLLELLTLQSSKFWEESPNKAEFFLSLAEELCHSSNCQSLHFRRRLTTNLAGRSTQRTGNRSHTGSSGLAWLQGQAGYSWVSLTPTGLGCRLEPMWELFTSLWLPGNRYPNIMKKKKVQFVCSMAL